MTDSPKRIRRAIKPGPLAHRKLATPVPASELWDRFRDLDILGKVSRGELSEIVISQHDPSPHANQPPGTKSQMVSYRDAQGNEIARAHRYLLPDGSLGASGKPDCKQILHNGVLYCLDTG